MEMDARILGGIATLSAVVESGSFVKAAKSLGVANWKSESVSGCFTERPGAADWVIYNLSTAPQLVRINVDQNGAGPICFTWNLSRSAGISAGLALANSPKISSIPPGVVTKARRNCASARL